ncbi:MAG: DegV family protein [Clostridium sp.]|nr:DegV family protein [Clostridium sp.]
MKTRIIVDSTVDVPEELRARMLVAPLHVRFGDEEFIDGVTITSREFYQRLMNSEVLPASSQPSLDSFEKIYEEVTAAGDEAVVLTISSKLSGTYQSACIAAEDYPNVHVVDTLTAAVGSGVLAELALQLADEGMDAMGIVERITAERENVCLLAVIDTLEYLKKGGRLSATAAFAGTLLSIKPLISVPNGEISVWGKARGTRKGNEMMIAELNARGVDFSKPVIQGYTGLSAELLEKFLADSAEIWAGHPETQRIVPICSVIGTHVGPGAYATAFFMKKA